jgi:acetolactate synthase-1/2/3 large subunit
MSTRQVRGGALVAKTLKKFGIKTIFSLPGHQILSVFDACLDEKIRLISARHELSAVYMAEGMSYATREMGVALLAGGPELTDALTGLAKAYYSHTPLLVISGTNPLAKQDMGFPQDMDQLDIVKPFTKWSRGCYDIRRIPEYIAAAFRYALRGRPDPVYIEIPYDVLEEEVKSSQIILPEKPLCVRSSGEEGSVTRALELIRKARRPIIIAGSGVFWSQAEDELEQLVRRSQIPLFITTAASAMKFPSELIMGIGTPAGGKFSLYAITRSDLIILLGTRLNFMLGFGKPPFISSEQKIVQVDIEPSELGKYRDVDGEVAGDIKEMLRRWNAEIDGPGHPSSWTEKLRKEREGFQKELHPLLTSENAPIHPLRLVKEMEDARAEDSFLVLDGSNSALWAVLGIRPRSKGQVLFSPIGDLEAIGAGIPHAMALKLHYPERDVILHTGDGSFGFCAMEFETAVREKIPIVSVIHNDEAWGMTRDMQAEFFGVNRQIGNTLGVVRYDLMVKALGGHGEFVENPEEIRPALERALSSGLPACVNVVVDPGPNSPGLMIWMMLEVLLGKKTYLDKIPDFVGRLERWHLDSAALSIMRKQIGSKIHKKMG